MFREGLPLSGSTPAEALRHGIVLIPEDRKAEGLHLELPVRWNLAMATLATALRPGVIQMGAEKAFADQKIAELKIRLGSPFQPASALSGGTQQKVVLGKFMARQPSVLLFVDPTRGIDVQTKFGVYEMIRGWPPAGPCVLYSSDTEELVGLCDRVAVFHDGVPVGSWRVGDQPKTLSLPRPSRWPARPSCGRAERRALRAPVGPTSSYLAALYAAAPFAVSCSSSISSSAAAPSAVSRPSA